MSTVSTLSQIIPNSPLMIVGEAPGSEEIQKGLPFVGASGKLLSSLLETINIQRNHTSITNVFLTRPERNDIATFCDKKKEVSEEYKLFSRPEGWPSTYSWPPISQGKYIRPKYFDEFLRLRDEIFAAKPRVILALGNTACIALLKQSGISKIRGTVEDCWLCPGIKVIPTYHPAAVLRQYSLLPIVTLDFKKALRHLENPDLKAPSRHMVLKPTTQDLLDFEETIDGALAFDIETAKGQITCIGFASSAERALVLPLVDPSRPNNSYWSRDEELFVLRKIKEWLEDEAIAKIAQNGLYDIQWILRTLNISVQNFKWDTMVLHHSIQPELPKGLGFLGSIYTEEGSWKEMRKGQSNKRDE